MSGFPVRVARPKAFDVVISALKCPLTAAYRKDGERWICTALEFDIVGIGSTRGEAFAEMQRLVHAYLAHVLNARGRVALLNRSAPEEWRTKDTVRFLIAVALRRPAQRKTVPAVIENVAALRRLRGSIHGMDLLPVTASARG